MISKRMPVAVVATILGLAVPSMVSASAGWADGDKQQGSVASGGVVLSMEAGAESMSGDITYQIGYPVTDAWGYTYNGYFPFSELMFPLDAEFAVVGAELGILDKYIIGLKVKSSVNEPDDYMEDRDWITETNTSRLDIYSDSEVTDFTSTIVDVDVSYRFFNNDKMSFAAGVGYLYQDFEYETALMRQWSPSGLSGYDYAGDGGVSLIYEVEAEIPYLAISGSIKPIPALSINARFAFAPWIQVDNKDQHLLRNKVNTGDLDGTATMASVEAEYCINQYLFVNGGFDYTYFEADGDMDATFYGIYDHTVTEEIDSSQTSVYATFGVRLGVPSQK